MPLTDEYDATTILLVEDEPAHAELIESNLRRGKLGNPIVRAGNGQEALDYLLSRGKWEGIPRPDSLLVLLDLNMPVIDGVQVLRTIKADPALRKIPVIVLTSTDEPREIESAYDIGCNAYVTKPVRYQAFAETIQGLGQFVTLLAVPKAA
ncbi:MAG: response regulator [Alphaproteobacteria bacterium]|jgi:CheY-like chemotaxis protein|nr:response regulator [Alphaproteobacteria bacterium]